MVNNMKQLALALAIVLTLVSSGVGVGAQAASPQSECPPGSVMSTPLASGAENFMVGEDLDVHYAPYLPYIGGYGGGG
jgi:hypothetical protein